MTVALTNNPGGSTLEGTLSVTATNGAATFTGLTLNEPGVGYTLSVSSNGLTAATTTPFNVTVPQLVVTAQPPAVVTAGISFGLTVTAEDSSGNADTSFFGTVTVALGINPGGGSIGGTLSVTAINGVATFSGLTLDEVGVGYTLSVSSSGLTAATSNAFDVQASGSPTHFTVDLTSDYGAGSGNEGDLRYVIAQADANMNPLGSLIRFDPTVFSSPQTITLNSALPDLSNTTGLMDIEGPGTSSLTVARSSAAGTPDFRIFKVDSDADVKLVDLTVTGGLVNDDNGGGIYNTGTLTVTDSTVDNNSASTNDGSSRYGGGIYNTGTLTVTNSTIDNNSTPQSSLEYHGPFAPSGGGGIDNEGGVLTLVDSQVSGNTSTATGGGIQSSGTTTIVGCSITGNQAQANYWLDPVTGGDGMGGGLCIDSGSVQLTDSTIQGNSVSGTSFLFSIDSSGGNAFGGGVYLTDATATITAVTISDNRAFGGGGGVGNGYPYGSPLPPGGSAAGGGIYLANGNAKITAATISGNRVAGGQGGGQYFNGPESSAFYGGDAGDAYGGGVSAGGSLVLVNDTIADNQALGGAGGASPYGPIIAGSPPPGNYFFITDEITDGNGGASFGGGIAGGPVTIVNSSIVANSTSGGLGGGSGLLYYTIYGELVGIYGVPDFLASASGGGVSASATLDNTIVALNTQGTGSGAPASDIAGSVSGAFNLIGTGGSGGLVNGTNGNQVGVADPGLDPRGLRNNGGPTQTIALVTGSPAIDAGSNALAVDPTTGQPLTTDQRGSGFPHIANGRVDIGAYEVQSYITGSAVAWGTQTAALQTASDGLRLLPAGRNTDLPWLGIDQVQLTLTQPAILAAGDITAVGSSGTNYGPVTVTGSGTSYTITLAQPINAADRVTITIGNDLIAPFIRRLDVLPGDVNDDGVVNVQDMVAIRNQMLGLLGAVPTIFGDINGDGKVDILDYDLVRKLIGTHW